MIIFQTIDVHQVYRNNMFNKQKIIFAIKTNVMGIQKI